MPAACASARGEANDPGPTRRRRVPYHPELLETPVPRYTSFPTAAEFGAIDAALYPAALESAALSGQAEGETDLFIYPGFQFRVVKRLLTNFHLPESVMAEGGLLFSSWA